jgi:Ca2+-binding EF-hand superfamily protein
MSSRSLVLNFSFPALLCMTLAAPPAVATADAQTGPVSRMRFQTLDRNNDGRITRDEWNGNERSFQNHDWNGDGVLSGDEVRSGAQRATELADHEPNRFERNLNWTQANFNALDHNRDNRLTANEWHFDLGTFRRIDRDRNDAISVQEFIGQGVDDMRDDTFDEMDWNNDGRVTRSEWHGGAADFTWLDRNRDGVLSRFEVQGAETSFDTWDQFTNLDFDRNGTLSRAEWHWSNASFSTRDRNRDGVISKQEFDVSGGAPASGSSVATNRTVRVNSQQRWTDTGIDVRAGDVITFNASGTITMSDDTGDTASPAGSTRGRRAPDAPVLNQLAGGLLASIGGWSPSFIGSRSSWTAPVGGRLYLGVNDDHLPDNRGEFVVQVGVQGRTLR